MNRFECWGARVCVRVSARFTNSRSLVIPAKNFASIFAGESVGHLTYDGVGLAKVSPTCRSNMLEHVIRGRLAALYPRYVFQDATRGFCHNGRRRSAHQAEYDWLCDGKRVELKSCMMVWRKTPALVWQAVFSNIKFKLFDELILALCTPEHIHVFRHDLRLGVSSQGKLTQLSGSKIALMGPQNEACWRVASEVMLSKLHATSNECEHLFSLSASDRLVQSTLAEFENERASAYTGVPLNALPPPSRGLALQRLVHAVDKRVHPGAEFGEAPAGVCTNGWRRGASSAECDWMRNGMRIECKSAKMHWAKTPGRWRFSFHHIKFGPAFDELLLALYTPRGVYVYRHDHRLGVSTNGCTTGIQGHRITFYASLQFKDWAEALDSILVKLDSSPCLRLAYVPWLEN